MDGATWRPPVDETLSTAPPLADIQADQQRCVQARGANRLTAITFSTTDSGASISGPNCGLVPALFTR